MINAMNNHEISIICKILGCPVDKRAGMFLNCKLEEKVDKGDILATLYSSDRYQLKEAIETLKVMPVYTVE